MWYSSSSSHCHTFVSQLRVVVLKENYGENGNLMNVTRDHYVIDETGNIITTVSTNSREGPKQTSCYYLQGSKMFLGV